ncbi:MAG: hypothetical protein PHD21_08155, partial [Flavobacteriales bacterium]|nr:hypothetical protein [Flavobacteriales bacterium]
MKEIILEKKNGERIALNSKNPLRGVTNGQIEEQLGGVDTLTLDIESATAVDFAIGDSIQMCGKRYYLNTLPRGQRKGNRHLAYHVVLDGAKYFMGHVLLSNDFSGGADNVNEVDFSFTGTFGEFMNMIVQNMNRVWGSDVWAWQAVDTEVDAAFVPKYDEVKTISFSVQNVLSATSTVCENWDADFKVEAINGVFTISVGRFGVNISQYTFSYGNGYGLYSLTCDKPNDNELVTRLYAYGSNKNIGSAYREGRRRLGMPLDYSSSVVRDGLYVQDDAVVQKYGLVEGGVVFEDVYPSREGVVSSVNADDRLVFTDDDMFDLNAKKENGDSLYLLSGSTAVVHFNTGGLAGYDFTVAGYNTTKRSFTLVPFTDENDFSYPSDTDAAFRISVGDKYILTGISLPDEYVAEAEEKLAVKAIEKYTEGIRRLYSYSLVLDELFVKKYFPSSQWSAAFSAGDYINIADVDLTDGAVALKVCSVVRDVYSPWRYTLTLGDGTPSSVFESVIKDTTQMSNIIKTNHLTDVGRSRRNARTTAEVLDMTFDTDGYFLSGKIRPETVETIMLSVGAMSGQFVLDGVVMQADYGGDVSRFHFSEGVLSHFGMEKDEIKRWNLIDGTVGDLVEKEPYYIYARCDKNGDAGTLVLDTKAVKYNTDDEFYFFLVGVLSSVNDGYRTFCPLYGSSTINGRFITTGRIESADGGTYFDLDAGEIAGKIIFSDNSTTEKGESIISGGKINTSLINTDTLIAKHIEAQDGHIAQFSIQEKQLVGDGGNIVFSNEEIATLQSLLQGAEETSNIPLSGTTNMAADIQSSSMSENTIEINLSAYQNITSVQVPYAGMITYRVQNNRTLTIENGGMFSQSSSIAKVEVLMINADQSETNIDSKRLTINTTNTISTYLPQGGTYKIVITATHNYTSAWAERPADTPADIYPTFTVEANISILGASEAQNYIKFAGIDQCTQIGTNGLYSFWSILNYLYFSKTEGFKLKGNCTITSANGNYSLSITDGGISISTPSANLSSSTALFTQSTTRTNIISGETLAILFGKIQKYFSDLKTVAFTGEYNDLSGKPTIPAAQVNADWNATSGKAQILNQPTSLPASDVSAWAKAANKPTYTATEVGALPDTTVIPTNNNQLTNGAGYITKTNGDSYYLGKTEKA